MGLDNEKLERALADMAPGYGEVLLALRDELRSEGRVGALFVMGSTAVGEADRYSDLDLVLVAPSGKAQSVARGLVELLERIAPVVMARWTRADLLSTVMSDWRRVDLTVLDVEGVSDRHAGPALRVFDELGIDDIPERVFARSPERLRDQIDRFLRSLGLLPRDVHRGDLRLCCFAVEFLVDELVSLMFDEIERVRGPKNGTYRRLPAASLEVLERMPLAYPEVQSVIEGHVAVAAAYLPRSRALADQWKVACLRASKTPHGTTSSANSPSSFPDATGH